DSGSFLNWIERLISARKQCSMIGKGEVQLIENPHKSIFIHAYDHSNEKILFIHNLGEEEVILNKGSMDFFKSDHFEFFGHSEVKMEKAKIRMSPYGFIWLKELAN